MDNSFIIEAFISITIVATVILIGWMILWIVNKLWKWSNNTKTSDYTRVPMKETFIPPDEVQPVEIYRMANSISPHGGFQDEYLMLGKDGDDVVIYLKDDEKRITVFKTFGTFFIGNDTFNEENVEEYHPGFWTNHLVELYLQITRQREEEERARKAQRFAKINDAHLFD